MYEFPRISPLHRLLLRWSLSRADLVLSTSRAMAEETRKYTARPIEVTPFGIDLERFTPRPPRPDLFPGEFVIGTTKSLVEVYGQEYLIRAFRGLVDEFPELPLRLAIAGRGVLESRLKSLAASLGLGDKVSFLGFVPNDEIHEYHARFDIFAALSNEESFGVAALEAQASGKPVVSTRVGGLPEVVEDGVTGFLVPPRDPEAARQALGRLIRDPDLRARMGREGRKRAEALYDRRSSVAQRASIYASVLEPRGGRARRGGRTGNISPLDR